MRPTRARRATNRPIRRRPKPMEPSSAVALVSGGASGLGLATVRRLAAAGAGVVLLDLPSSDGAAVADELGDRVRFSPGDVTKEADVAEAVAAAAEFGRLNV